MRSWTDGRRRSKRASARDRSRFRKGSGEGGRDLIRFRRNREMLWREISTLVLWIGLAVMLVNLSRTLHRVSAHHLAERAVPIRLALPALSIVAAAGCLWRARNGWIEIRDIRREQNELTDRLRRRIDDDPDAALGP